MSFGLKAIGASLVAILIVGEMLGLDAPAKTGGHFTSEASHTNLSGSGTEGGAYTSSATGFEIECEVGEFAATTGATTVTEVTVEVSYSECEDQKLGVPAHVSMNGCYFVATFSSNPASDNTIHLSCPTGKVAKITVTGPFGSCEITVKPQTPTGGVAYETVGSGSGHEVKGNATVSGIHAVYDGGPFKCAVSSGATVTNDVLTGKALVSGYDTEFNEQLGVTAT